MIQINGIRICERMMKKKREKVHDILKNRDGIEEEGKNVKVSCDGSWSERGFTSNYGFVSVRKSNAAQGAKKSAHY